MKKILLLIFSCFLIFGCFDQNGDVKKESLEKENIKIQKNNITMAEYKIKRDNGSLDAIVNEVLTNRGITKEYLKNLIDENDKKIDIIKDDFNKENKITPINEKKSDKIKIELYETILDDEALISDYSLRGNITFTCVNNRYFSFDKIIVLTDKNRYEIKGDFFSQDSDFENGKSYQNVKYIIDLDKLDLIMDMANSENIKIRFTKNDNNLDFKLKQDEIERIRTMYEYIYVSNIFSRIFKKIEESLL